MEGVAIKGSNEKLELNHPFGAAVEIPSSLGAMDNMGDGCDINTVAGTETTSPNSQLFKAEEEQLMSAILQDV
eukprot:SAG31_NODE_1020_length_10349_cov_5.621561_5_plen_73_part_00